MSQARIKPEISGNFRLQPGSINNSDVACRTYASQYLMLICWSSLNDNWMAIQIVKNNVHTHNLTLLYQYSNEAVTQIFTLQINL